MSVDQVLEEIRKMSPADQNRVRAELATLDDDWLPDCGLSDEQKAELDSEIAEIEKDPTAGEDWDVVYRELKAKYRS